MRERNLHGPFGETSSIRDVGETQGNFAGPHLAALRGKKQINQKRSRRSVVTHQIAQ
jgi:hypothetical protein